MSSDIPEITEETKKKMRDFDEQEAYFLLCQIFSYAQTTKDYARFQSDLAEWKKRYNVELFSDEFKAKIKYMLSKEFLDTILKNFVQFDELSKKDPAIGLEKFRKVFSRAENHKDEKQLDKDLAQLYKEYPLKFLKEKYPHIISLYLSKSYKTKILEKFDSSLAFKELENITKTPQTYSDINKFKSTIEEWQKLYPTDDFNDKYKSQVEQILTNVLDDKNLNEWFPISTELDLSEGQVIPLDLKNKVQNISIINKDALYEFFKIVDRDKKDINSLFEWICKYSKYINSFDSASKDAIVENLMKEYSYEIPRSKTNFQIPKMESHYLLSLNDYTALPNTKKDTVVQLLGILYTGNSLTDEDIDRLNTINSNVEKAKIIDDKKVDLQLEIFKNDFQEDKLTPSDPIYLSNCNYNATTNDTTEISLPNDNLDTTELIIQNTEGPDVPVENNAPTDNLSKSFRETLKVETPLEKAVFPTSSNSNASSTSGGSSTSIATNDFEVTEKNTSESEEARPSEEPDKDNYRDEY